MTGPRGVRARAVAACASRRRARRQKARSGALAAQVRALREELGRRRDAEKRLEQLAASAEASAQALYSRYAGATSQGAHIATLLAVTERIQRIRGVADVWEAVREIVEGMVGSDEVALFRRDAEGEGLALVAATGVDAAQYARVPWSSSPIGVAARSGHPYFAPAPSTMGRQAAPSLGGPGSAVPSACVPLVDGGESVGAIAIFGLFEHKPALTSLDHEVLAVLASCAARALRAEARQEKEGG